MAAPVLELHDELWVVRDDLLPGGTKRRFLTPLFARWPEAEFVYAGPVAGYAQTALGWAAADTGKRATLFVAARARPHPLTLEAIRLGVSVVECRPGYLSVVSARARKYAADVGARMLPLGFDCPDVIDEAARVLAGLRDPFEVWCAAGSGVLSRALQRAYPGAVHHAVRVGRPPDVGGARLWTAPEAFEGRAQVMPPYPSAPTYDAKLWRFAHAHAVPGALVWNVGA